MKIFSKSVIAKLLIAPVIVLGAAVALPSLSVAAEDDSAAKCDSSVTIKTGSQCAKSAQQKGSLGNVIKDITNVLLFLIGAVSVIMIIIGGIRYVLSNGDSTQITSAKNTILYAVIGIIVSLLAYAIVNFVVTSFTAAPSDASETAE